MLNKQEKNTVNVQNQLKIRKTYNNTRTVNKNQITKISQNAKLKIKVSDIKLQH